MFNSFQVQDSELAGTKSIGVGLQYDFETVTKNFWDVRLYLDYRF